MSLALQLGEPDPDALLARMRPTQLAEWLAFYDISPWGDERADLRSALVCEAVHQAAGSKRSDGQPISAEMFMPFRERKVVPLARKALSFLKNLPSAVKRKGK